MPTTRNKESTGLEPAAPTKKNNPIPREQYSKTGLLGWMAQHTSAAAAERYYAERSSQCPIAKAP